MSKLNALKIKSITRIGMHSDGNGLYLKVQPSTKHSTINKSWIFRWGAQGKNTMGLGSVKDITLAEARELAIECSRLVARGLNPKEERDKIHAEKQAEKENSITFSEASKQYIEIHKASWKNKKHGQQWEKTLETYAFDVIGNKSCSAVTKEDVLKILTPIWTTKTETATRVRGRIESVLDWAKAKGYVKGENVAVLKGNLQALLPQIKKRQRVVFDSHGGSGDTAKEIGKLIRARKLNTYLAIDAECFCLCTPTNQWRTTICVMARHTRQSVNAMSEIKTVD